MLGIVILNCLFRCRAIVALRLEGLRVAEISARRKISAHVICGSEERPVDWSVSWFDQRILFQDFLLSTGPSHSGVAGRQDGASRHVGCFRVRSTRGYGGLACIRVRPRKKVLFCELERYATLLGGCVLACLR